MAPRRRSWNVLSVLRNDGINFAFAVTVVVQFYLQRYFSANILHSHTLLSLEFLNDIYYIEIYFLSTLKVCIIVLSACFMLNVRTPFWMISRVLRKSI